ncbi:MAG: SNF2-related protein [Gammaproteobacteria bacterium]
MKQSTAKNEFFIYDADRFAELAPERIVKQGLDAFNENRVFELEYSGKRIHALVEDAESDEPLSVELLQNGDDLLETHCTCGSDTTLCRHAVAALYAYADQFAVAAEALTGAVDEAILERVRKGRNEVNVKQTGGELYFGTWQASSITSATHWPQVYQVQIRSLTQRSNYCTCPDLANNRLGTCKHIEAVLHRIQKHKQYKAALKSAANAPAFTYLAWESATHPRIKIQRSAQQDAETTALLNAYFDAEGIFKERLPEGFFRFAETVYGRDNVQVGEDSLAHVRRLAQEAAQTVRGAQIQADIVRSGGILPGIRARLFPYQVEGVAFLASKGRALLADDMGLGKTLQAISAAHWLAENEGVERVLVVCPASLKHQWAREIDKFTGHQAQIVQGPAAARGVQYRSARRFTIVNYELVLRDLAVIGGDLRPDLLILDEAQRIKNWQTKIASTIKLIPSRHAFVLSGTPLENRLQDLYSLLQVVDARVLGPLWRCMLDFHITDERGKVLGYRNLSELRQRLKSVMLRRDRALVSDQLPERTEVRLDIPMRSDQIALHDDALAAAGRLAQIAKNRPLTPNEHNRLMAALQTARMACNAAGLVDKESEGSPKLDELARLLEELCLQSNRKAVIFSQWERMTAMVEKQASAMGLGCVRLHGGVPTHKRGELMDRFRDDDAVQLFISTDAGGTGLNLQAATVLINLDMPWNPAVLEQRIARVHRLGQKCNVQIFLLLAENSYEERVAQLVQGKRHLFDNVVNPEAEEDVVGVSKQMLQTLIDDLAGGEPTPLPEEPEAETPDTAAAEPQTTAAPAAKSGDSQADRHVHDLIRQLQSEFGARIERIVGANGGLLVALRQLRDEDDYFVQSLAAEIPLVLVTPAALAGLQRLSVAGDNTLFVRDDTPVPAAVHPLLQKAQEQLQAAEVLLERDCQAGVMALLGSALLAWLAVLSDAAQPLNAEQAALWLYGEALPAGRLGAEQAAAVVRTLSLSQAASVPAPLVRQSLDDTRTLLAGA